MLTLRRGVLRSQRTHGSCQQASDDGDADVHAIPVHRRHTRGHEGGVGIEDHDSRGTHDVGQVFVVVLDGHRGGWRERWHRWYCQHSHRAPKLLEHLRHLHELPPDVRLGGRAALLLLGGEKHVVGANHDANPRWGLAPKLRDHRLDVGSGQDVALTTLLAGTQNA